MAIESSTNNTIRSKKFLSDRFSYLCEIANAFVKNIPEISSFEEFEEHINASKSPSLAALACVGLAHPSRRQYDREDLYVPACRMLEKNKDNNLFCIAVEVYDDAYLQLETYSAL